MMFSKAKLALSAALVLALGGAAMAYDGGDYNDGGSKVRPAPQTTAGGGNGAIAKPAVQPHVVKHRVKK
jgi:hypothetical protein